MRGRGGPPTAVVIVVFAASFFFPKKLMPVMYLLRGVLFIQVTAQLFFLFLPARFSHSPDSYMEGLTGYAIGIISFVPILFGLTYYIFDFGIVRKAFLTIITMGHLSLFLPVQILAAGHRIAEIRAVHADPLHRLRVARSKS